MERGSPSPSDVLPLPHCACAACADRDQSHVPAATKAIRGDALSAEGAADSIPADVSTTAVLVLGVSDTGIINTVGDRDWFRIDLTAGNTYSIALDGTDLSGFAAVSDPYLRLYDQNGQLIASDDDGGPGLNSLLRFTAQASGTFHVGAAAFDDTATGGYSVVVSEATPIPTFTLDQIADFLRNGYWDGSGGAHRWSTAVDNIVTFNLTGLTANGQTLARAAFAAWAEVANLVFSETAGAADITLDDNQAGAFAGGSWSNGFISSMNVNVSTSWLATNGTGFDSYSFQTYVHEIGHALGLGHGGDYNGNATYGVDNHYANDVWSYTVMSYFDQEEAGLGSRRFVMGPQLADIVAVQGMYGANTSTRTGDTTYGHNSNAGTLFSFASFATAPAFTIYDQGGTDAIDASGYGQAQTIDLNEQAFSSIGGYVRNISIARGTVIENARGGSGADLLVGNAQANTLEGNHGADTFIGGPGADRLVGGPGLDTASYADAVTGVAVDLALQMAFYGPADGDTFSSIENATGGAAVDNLYGSSGDNVLTGLAGSDNLFGYDGNDTIYGFGPVGSGVDDDTTDYIDGGIGNDTLLGGGGIDYLYGGADNDVMHGGTGVDVLYGNDGNDSLFGLSGSGTDDGTTDYMDGGAGNDTLYGNGGIDYLYGGIGSDTLDGGDGVDVLYGEADGDTLNGGAATDYMDGGAGDDTLNGDDGIDYLYGGAGIDTLRGGNDGDVLQGNAGNDTLTGGAGFDYFQMTAGMGVDTITDFEDGIDRIDLTVLGIGLSSVTVTQSGADALVVFGAEQMLVQGIAASSLTASDFYFL